LPVVRAIGALLGYYAIAMVVASLIVLLVPQPWGQGMPGVIAPVGVQLAGGALAADFAWWKMGWRSWKHMGWPGPAASVRGFGIGLAVGLGMAAAALLLEIIAGHGHLSFTGEPFGAYLAAAAATGGALLIAALSEELLFRGFPLERLADVIGPAGASLLLAVGFAGMHALNPGATPLGLLNVAVASLSLSAVYFRLGGIPAAWGTHFGWNAGLSLGADAPVSGIPFQLPGIEYAANGSGWITGGSFGPEGGVIATVVMGVVVVWLGRGVIRGQGPGIRGQEAR
jgi:membrane protease YdiL (CAAX protease family)